MERLTAHMKAAGKGHTAIVEYLDCNQQDLDQCDKEGMNAVMYAAMGGHTATVKSLVDRGADLSIISNEGSKDLSKSKKTALDLAIDSKRKATYKYLCSIGAKRETKDERMPSE